MNAGTDLIVIGGSAGAIGVLRDLLAGLPAGFRAAAAVVIHLPADGPALLPEVLAPHSQLPMKFAEDKERIEPGMIYFAVPDYHLLVEKGGTFALSLDERVHYSRPAIDVLFESAAEAFGERLVGIILSGANADGAAGLKAVAEAGGVALVQSPDSAEMAAMPAAALQAVPQGTQVDAASLAQCLRAHVQTQVKTHGR